MSEFPTGNPHRDGAIIAVLRELISEGTPTYSAAATRCNRYGASFDGLSPAEFNEALAMLQRVETVGDEQAEPPVAQPEPSSELEMTVDQLHVALADANNALAIDRQALARGLIAQKKAADALAAALFAWQTGGEKLSPIENAKAVIASNQQRKQALRDGTLHEPVRGRRLRSVVDRQAAYSHGGDAADFVRGRMQNRGSHRGAYPSSMRGHRVAPPSEQ